MNGEPQKIWLPSSGRATASRSISRSPKAPGIVAEDIPLRILFADDDVIVIDKPAGMVVHPGRRSADGDVGQRAAPSFSRNPRLGRRRAAGDRPPAGQGNFGRHGRRPEPSAAYAELKRQFKAREVKKVYLALVWGRLPRDRGPLRLADRPPVKHGQRMSIRTRTAAGGGHGIPQS